MKLSPSNNKKIKEIAKARGISESEVIAIVSSPYYFMNGKLSELSFEDGLTRKEFEDKKTNFNIPSIGKLYASHYLYKIIQNNKNKNKK